MKPTKNPFMLIILMSCIFATSCKNVILSIAGMRVPKIESKESTLKFLHKLNQDTSDVFAIDTVMYEELQHESFKPGMLVGFRPIQVRMYNKQGDPIMQWASCEGYLEDLKVFDSVPPKNPNTLNTSLNLQKDLSRYYSLNGTPANIATPPEYDYYILVYFAKYFYKMSKESFKEVDKYKKMHPELKIKVYKISVDIQEFWNADLHVDMKVQYGGSK